MGSIASPSEAHDPILFIKRSILQVLMDRKAFGLSPIASLIGYVDSHIYLVPLPLLSSSFVDF